MPTLGNIVVVAQQLREKLGNGAPEILEHRASQHLNDNERDAARYWLRVAKAARYLNSFEENYLPRGGRQRGSFLAHEPMAERVQTMLQPAVLLQPNLVIVAVNTAYLAVTGTRESDLLGAELFDVFPDNPANDGVPGSAILGESFGRVLDACRPDALSMMRYDVRDRDGVFQKRWWNPSSLPVLDDKGRIRFILHHAVEVTGNDALPAATALAG